MTGSEESPSFRLAYVPGATPGKWVRIWQERLPETPLRLVDVTAADAPDVLRRGDADAGLVRLPVDTAVFSAIPLYTETSVVVVPKDHLVAAADEVVTADLADDIVLHPLDDTLDWESLPGRPALERPATTADAVELVAAGIGVLVVPQSLARLHHRKDLTYRPVTDAPQSRVALAWPEDRTTDLVDDFIGIVRGRTVNSTRGRRATASETPSKSPSKSPSRSQSQDKRGRAGGGAQRKASGAGKGSGTGSGSGGKSAGRNPRGGSAAGTRGNRRGKPRRRS